MFCVSGLCELGILADTFLYIPWNIERFYVIVKGNYMGKSNMWSLFFQLPLVLPNISTGLANVR